MKLRQLCWTRIFIIQVSILLCTVVGTNGCPRGCTCTIRSKSSDEIPGRRVVCHPSTPFTSIDQVEPKFPIDTLQLDLSENALTTIHKSDFNGLAGLQKLDLSHNRISFIQPGSFERLQNLERLDLSVNELSSVNRSMFEGLVKLQRLSLSGNQIKSIAEGTFDPLTALKRIDFQSELLMCDCNLSWIFKWIKKTEVRINSNTKCAVPRDMKDKSVKTLKKKDLHCNWPVEVPLFELMPNTNQVVFQGDQLPFKCKASVVDPGMRLLWIREDRVVSNNKTQMIKVNTSYSPDRTIMIQNLWLGNLDVQDSGIWKCVVVTERGNVTKVVNIVVISEDTLYCPPVITRTNKGTFSWPKTVSGVTVEMQCDTGRSSDYLGHNPPKAFHTCNNNGQWGTLNTAQCQYQSEKTKVLEQFAKAINEREIGNLTKRAGQLRDYIRMSKTPTEKMDVIFVGRIVDRLSHFVQDNDRLSEVILSMVSMMMDVEKRTLTDAQIHDQACTRMVEAVDSLPSQQLREDRRSIRQAVKNIALRAYTIKSSNFPGFSCTVRDNRRSGFTDNSLTCNKNPNFTENYKGNQAIVHLPGSTFDSLECYTPICSKGTFYQLQFIMYQNTALFPLTGRRAETSRIGSMIVSCRIVGSEVSNMTEPISISMRMAVKGGNPKPVFWTGADQDAVGQWSSEGCQVVKTSGYWVTFQCNHLTHFAILQDKNIVDVSVIPWYRCILDMGPIVYAGSAILFIAACAVCITYITCHNELKMPDKCKHSIANLCLSFLLLVLIFTFGVRMTGHELTCQIMGMSLHYLSICTLFWILINAYNMYKKFMKAQQPPEPEPEPSDGPLPPKPMLRFYLVGWGIALIVCGITAAVNVHFYFDDKPYCFLSYEPILGAFLVPVGILFTLICIFFIRIACLLRGVTSFMPIDEPETEEINDLELTSPEIESLPNDHGDSSITPSSSEVDLEYRPISQLRALALILLLYILMWTSGAFAIALPFPNAIPNQELIFTYSYAFFATLLALFIFVYYCIGRSDARKCWRRFCCCERRPVYVVNGAVRTSNNIVHANGHVLRSSSSLDSQFTNKSNSTTNRSNPLKNIHPKKQSNINLVPSQTASMTDHTLSSIHENMPSFYNPRQNGVAKRYWEKKGKNKQINLLMKEANSMRSGSMSSFTTDNHSQVENEKNSNNIGAKDINSDTNHYMNIVEVQVQNHVPLLHAQNKSSTLSQPSSPKIPKRDNNPPSYNSLPRPLRTYSPLTVQTPGLLPVTNHTTVDRNSVSPAGSKTGAHIVACPQPVIGLPGGSVYQPRLLQFSPSPMPPLQQPSVVDYPSIPPPPSYGVNLNPVAVNNLNEAKTLAQMHSNSLPRLGKGQYNNNNKYLQRNGSVPRLRDYDGQNETSRTEPRRPSINTEIRNLEMYKPPEPPITQPIRHRHLSGECLHKLCDCDETSDQEVANLNKRSHSSDCGTGRRRRKNKCETFMDELEQRIPNNRSSPCPSLGRSHSGGIERHNRSSSARPNSMSQDSEVSGEQEHGSLKRNRRSRSYDPSTANQRHSTISNNTNNTGTDSNKEFKRDSRSSSRRSTKDWDNEFRDKPKKSNASYAYVNHTYQDKVMSKLIQQSSNGLIDPIARGLSWLPRSVSAYEAVNSEPTDLPDDSSSSSSSDDSTDDIWVLQKRKKRKFKKETSV